MQHIIFAVVFIAASAGILWNLRRLIGYLNIGKPENRFDRIGERIKNVLVVAHGNSIRAIMKILENIPDDKIVDLNLTTGLPYVYEMDHDLQIKEKYTVDVRPPGR